MIHHRHHRSLCRLVVPTLLLLCTPLLADPGWLLTTADFRQEPVSYAGVGPDGVQVLPLGADQPVTVAYDQFLQLERISSPRAPERRFTLFLTGGDRIVGEPVELQGEQIVWKSDGLGELKIPLKDVRALLRAGRSIDDLNEARAEDMILMANGDSVKGIVADISPTRVTIQAAAPLDVPLDAIAWVHFAQTGSPQQPAAPLFRVRLADGTAISSTSIVGDARPLILTVADQSQRELSLALVIGLEQLNGPVSWLSSRTPDQVVQIPFFSTLKWPTRMDRTVGGRPIRFGARTYARGIGVHAYSRLEYALDGSWQAFRTQYAIAEDDKRQYADVTVRIKVDDDVVHEQAGVKAGVLSPVVLIDIPPSAKRLVLEVDYGQANDTQDRFNWIEPALLRSRPEPPQK